MKKSRKRIITVIGMHRSGTSVTARGLIILGADLGNNLMQPLPDNPKGFWEDDDITGLNDAILNKIGSVWHDTRVIDRFDLLNQHLQSESDAALELLTDRLSRSKIFAFKDPRVSILLPFWRTIFLKLDVDDSYVISLRHPISVAESLLRRDGIEHEQSFLLWTKYTLNAMRYSEGRPRIVVDYDNMLASPASQLGRISKALDLRSPFTDKNALEKYQNDFITTSLRHDFSDLSTLESSSRVLNLTTACYKWVFRLANDEIDFNNPSFLTAFKEIEKNFAELSSLYVYIERLIAARREAEEKHDETLNQLTSRINMIDELNSQLNKNDETIRELKNYLQQKNEECKHLKNEIDIIYKSKSWELTRPLRALRNLLR